MTLVIGAVVLAESDRAESEEKATWPLIFAAGEGDVDEVTRLLDQGVDIMQRSKDGETAVHVAAIKGHIPTLKLLIARGADVDARTPKGSTLYMTPAMWALYHGHAEFVRLLLQAGANPAAADENGKTLLTMAKEAQQPKIAEMLEVAVMSKNAESLARSLGADKTEL